MLRKALVCASALYFAAYAPSPAADLSACPSSVQAPCGAGPHRAIRRSEHRWTAAANTGGGVGVAFGLTPGVGQLGSYGYGYYAVNGCWSYRPAYNAFGDYVGQQPVNTCEELPVH